MDNFQQPTQTNPIPPENFSEPKKRMNSKIIVICILVGLMVSAATGYGFYKYSQLSTQKATCSLSGQTAQGKISERAETKFTELPSNARKNGEIIARVLNSEPFMIEILDRKPYPSDIFDGFGIQEYLFISQSEKNKIRSLKSNDIISADLYGFIYAANELAAGTVVKDIKKIDGQFNYFYDSPNPFANRSGTLIRYAPEATISSNEFMLIFNDGKVFYRDNNHNIFADKQLTEKELEDLLKLYSQTKFNDIPSDFSVSRFSPNLTLVCSRYQPVPLNQNSSYLKPITDKLDSIIDSYRIESTRKLTYNRKRNIENWQYGNIVPLSEANKVTFRQENRSKLSQIKPPDELLKEAYNIDDYNNPQPSSKFYRENGKLYTIIFGNCADGSAGTWGCFSVNEFRSDFAKIWPQGLSIKLKDIPAGGIEIPKEEYLEHKDFYDTLSVWLNNLFFSEDDIIYEGLWVALE